MIAWAAAADCAASRPLRATVAPSSERVRAMARPIPAVEPVTRAILPSSESCTVLPPIQRHIAVAGQGTGMVAILGPCCLQDEIARIARLAQSREGSREIGVAGAQRHRRPDRKSVV